MGHTAKLSVLPLSRILLYLKTGELDMSLEFHESEDRKALVYYSDLPILFTTPSIAVLKDNKINKIYSLDAFKGMTIGYVVKGSPGDFFTDLTGIRFDLTSGDNWLEMNLTKLANGRIDAVLNHNQYAFIPEAIKMAIENKIKILSLPMDEAKGYVIFSKKPPKSKVWLQEFNAVNATGKFNENKMIEDYLNLLRRQGF